MTKNENEIKLIGIPHGSLTLEEFMKTEVAKKMISGLKNVASKPEDLLCGFLIAYQFEDILKQFDALGYYAPPESEARGDLFRLSVQNVKQNIAHIANELGQKKVETIMNAVLPQPVNLRLIVS